TVPALPGEEGRLPPHSHRTGRPTGVSCCTGTTEPANYLRTAFRALGAASQSLDRSGTAGRGVAARRSSGLASTRAEPTSAAGSAQGLPRRPDDPQWRPPAAERNAE